MNKIPNAVLFDMDGTIIDSEPHWLAAEMELAEEYGFEWSLENALRYVGSGLGNTAQSLIDHGVRLTVAETIDALTNKVLEKIASNHAWRPGALELIRELKSAGIKTALVTMSIRRMAGQIVAGIDFEAFDLVVAGDMVQHPKPHPEPYLFAARNLGVDITSCVAFEDSVTGITSAAASGALAIAVPNHVLIPKASNYHLLDTLDGFGYSQLLDFYNTHR